MLSTVFLKALKSFLDISSSLIKQLSNLDSRNNRSACCGRNGFTFTDRMRLYVSLVRNIHLVFLRFSTSIHYLVPVFLRNESLQSPVTRFSS
ncbi:hypothetical protein Mapa_005234 [Marchantia paleacea]|nr:hypothetical protein Mapa_005234 [Marchantia paleacea]